MHTRLTKSGYLTANHEIGGFDVSRYPGMASRYVEAYLFMYLKEGADTHRVMPLRVKPSMTSYDVISPGHNSSELVNLCSFELRPGA